MTTKADELLPCPFCGEPPIVNTRRNSDLIEVFEIRCVAGDCMVIPRISVRVEQSGDAIEAWNTRTRISDEAADRCAAKPNDVHVDVELFQELRDYKRCFIQMQSEARAKAENIVIEWARVSSVRSLSLKDRELVDRITELLTKGI